MKTTYTKSELNIYERKEDGKVIGHGLVCPGCNGRGDIDDDQLHGRISCDCGNPDCPEHFHITQ